MRFFLLYKPKTTKKVYLVVDVAHRISTASSDIIQQLFCSLTISRVAHFMEAVIVRFFAVWRCCVPNKHHWHHHHAQVGCCRRDGLAGNSSDGQRRCHQCATRHEDCRQSPGQLYPRSRSEFDNCCCCRRNHRCHYVEFSRCRDVV